mmetsp:Transcript_14764/g.26788  ORF Transcript_14764/g.26788 Transcript_14764/m.26788 type:complete len:217 (-) Transcript_14764:16-666(-)
MQKLLSGRRRNQSSTTGGRNETNTHGTTLSSDLTGHSMGHASNTSPVSTADGSDVELGSRDGSTNSSGNLRRALNTKTNVSSVITNGNESLKAGPLTSRTLLLDGHDLHDLILKLVLKEVVNDLGLLDGKRKEEDFLDASDLSLLDKTTKLGHGDPLTLSIAITASSASTAPAAISTSATPAAFTALAAASTAKSSTFVRHINKLKLCKSLGAEAD